MFIFLFSFFCLLLCHLLLVPWFFQLYTPQSPSYYLFALLLHYQQYPHSNHVNFSVGDNFVSAGILT